MAPAAAHAVLFEVWLASSMLADATAVASQTLMGQALAAREQSKAVKVAIRSVQLSAALGVVLGLVLLLGQDRVPQLFTQDAATLAAAASVWPIMAASQPLNALAFVWDGVLFGAKGFRCARLFFAVRSTFLHLSLPCRCRYAALVMPLSAVPAVAAIVLAQQSPDPEQSLLIIWTGFVMLMAIRAASIWLPFRQRALMFAGLPSQGAADEVLYDGAEQALHAALRVNADDEQRLS